MSKVTINKSIETNEIVTLLMNELITRIETKKTLAELMNVCNDYVINVLSAKEGKQYNKTIAKAFENVISEKFSNVNVSYAVDEIVISCNELNGTTLHYILTKDRFIEVETIIDNNKRLSEMRKDNADKLEKYDNLDLCEVKMRNNVSNIKYHLEKLGEAMEQHNTDFDDLQYAYELSDSVGYVHGQGSVYLSQHIKK